MAFVFEFLTPSLFFLKFQSVILLLLLEFNILLLMYAHILVHRYPEIFSALTFGCFGEISPCIKLNYARAAVMILLLMYSTITQSCISILHCVTQDSRSIVFQYPTVECSFQSAYAGWFAIAIVSRTKLDK